MAMFSYDMDVSQIKDFKEAIASDLRAESHGPLRESLLQAGFVYSDYLHGRFYTGGGDKPWEPLSGRTVLRKGHGIILVDTGELQSAFGRGGEAAIIPQRNGFKIQLTGTSAVKAARHQSGTSRMPARPVIVEPDQQTKGTMLEIIRRGVSETLKKTQAGQEAESSGGWVWAEVLE